MRTQRFALVFAVLVPSFIAVAGEKPHNWQQGTVLDTDRSRYLFGVYSNASSSGTATANGISTGNMSSATGSYSGHSYGSSRALYKVYENYVIQSSQFAYLTEERLRFRWSKPARLIVNAPVQFAAEGSKLYIQDLDGNIHETRIVKQVERTTAAPAHAPTATNASREQSPSSAGLALTNDDVLKMKSAGLSDELVFQKITSSPANYHLNPDDLVSLKRAGLSDALVTAMMTQNKNPLKLVIPSRPIEGTPHTI
jgi:hypothetical protein